MKPIDPMSGRFNFEAIGVGKFAFTIDIKGEADFWTFLRSKIKTPDLDWSYDPVKNEGKIWSGDIQMGSFKKVPGSFSA